MSSAPSADLFQPLRQDDPPVVGGYRLAAVLGAGGMGKVYLTYTPGGRPIALKVIRPEFSEDPEFRRRFQQEVTAAQRVQGLYTAPVIDFDTEGAQPWLATAYVPGPSLAHAVSQHGALPLRSVLLLAVGVAEALHVIHGAGIVHRDLKPANVLLAADGPRVIDFGIARAADATALTGNGVTVGTPSFMAPEQAAAGTVTPATDIFALGQIMAYAAIGVPAYGDGPSHAVLYRIVHEEPDLSRLPAELHPLVTRCLARDPEQRISVPEIIELCQSISPTPLRQGEDWLPQAVAGSITERLRLPEPAKTPPPMPSTAPTPTQVTPPGTPMPGNPYAASAGFGPAGPAGPAHPASQPTATAHAAQMPGYSTPPPTPAPGYATPRPTPAPFRPTPMPGAPGAGWTPPQPKKSRGWVAALAIVGGLVLVGGCLAAIGSQVDDPKDSTTSGSSSSGSSGGSTGSDAPTTGAKRQDPKPVTYKGINVPGEYYVMLADSPIKPIDSSSRYSNRDFYFYYDSTGISDPKLETDNGKMVLLNNSQHGSLETCRSDTRYATEITFDQVTPGSEICLLSDAGHIAVVTYRGRSGQNSPSTFVTIDVTVWRNAEEAKPED